jgi:hypothetical protein
MNIEMELIIKIQLIEYNIKQKVMILVKKDSFYIKMIKTKLNMKKEEIKNSMLLILKEIIHIWMYTIF